tara:strand:+ start:2200 stop:2589 length:390 start_codon:yes stop_codon:yes gene_type:complete
MNETKYSDISLNFQPNPFTGDISIVTDENAVKQSIKNLVLTNFYDRPHQEKKGGNITGSLFENLTPNVVNDLKDRVTTVIENYEPRADLRNVEVYRVKNNKNAICVKITFKTRTTENAIVLDVFLKRVS